MSTALLNPIKTCEHVITLSSEILIS